MKLQSILSFFVPKDNVFLDLFAQSTANLVATASVFNEMINHTDVSLRSDYTKRLKDLEHAGDEITHRIFTELSSNFITPFDREDIHYLATSLDDIVDFIYGSATRLNLYQMGECSSAMKKLAEIIEKQAKEIDVAVVNMKSMSNVIRIREALVRINSLENNADDVFDEALANLFVLETDAVKIIKVKEILANMETATDKCEDVANVIETIIIKQS
ncbi:MAG: DUF47 domain-containing protein [Bacteroidetes bacterium]|nr:DUF47 domain-containing protein [Bacteroidota bacterium]MBK8658945.1 DUF47 domain-containing protein [Bacteroidota bacterium]